MATRFCQLLLREDLDTTNLLCWTLVGKEYMFVDLLMQVAVFTNQSLSFWGPIRDRHQIILGLDSDQAMLEMGMTQLDHIARFIQNFKVKPVDWVYVLVSKLRLCESNQLLP